MSVAALCARIDGHELISQECRRLTGGVPDSAGVALCDDVGLVHRAAYVHQGVRVIARGATLDELVAAVECASFEADGFRIEVSDRAKRIGSPTHDVIMRLADALPFDPDLDDPRHRFVVVLSADEWLFTEVTAEAEVSYRSHDAKPWTTSSSLDSRMARALVNLVPEARSILDPCCGAGSIVLEAASVGVKSYGVDWKPAMAGMTRENLAYFGQRASVVKSDARTYRQEVDAVVTDLPYGYAIDADERTTRQILAQCIENAPAGVFVAVADMSDWLVDAGYGEIDVCTVTKRQGFARWVHVVTRG